MSQSHTFQEDCYDVHIPTEMLVHRQASTVPESARHQRWKHSRCGFENIRTEIAAARQRDQIVRTGVPREPGGRKRSYGCNS